MGIHYGLGMMQIRFKEFFFLLKNFPKLQGHIGVGGVYAWYDPETKAGFVLNVGNNKDMPKSFRLLIKILKLIQKEKNSRDRRHSWHQAKNIYTLCWYNCLH